MFNRKIPKKSMPRHITLKLLKIKDRKILKAAWGGGDTLPTVEKQFK